ncbi:MAG: efflux transporter outer membrane subunit, partial [Betaproteobacteria bacterium]|nr:efflux transporter outer membrane subunit [Betaproteobacteria bacterium]
MKRRCIDAVAIAALPLAAACTVGPDYVRPDAMPPNVAQPAAYKELAGWKQAQPRDDAARGKWWEVFGDPLLNSLQEQVVSNQDLAQAEARYRQALALLASARALRLPSASGAVSATRSRASETTRALSSSAAATSYNLPFNAAWEADLWGRIGRGAEAAAAGAQASAADLETARLSLHAQLAQSYFQLRALDSQRQLLEQTIAGYEKSLQLSQNQYKAGVVSKSDVVQAQTQLKTTQAQLIDIGVARAQLEHAIGVLAGRPPSGFSVARAPLAAVPPSVPVGLPSELLERRPDVAAAERRMAQANALVGVAEAAYFPSLTISAGAGFQSS